MKNYIQIGANIGNDDFQKIVENLTESSTIILVEPNILLLEQLSNNYKHLNDKHNIIIYPYGISIKNEIAEFYQYGEIYGNYSLINRKTHPLKNNVTTSKIETVTFNKMCDYFSITDIELLFIDTEGMDYEILNSIDLTKINIETIIFEKWIFDNDDINNNFRTGQQFLNDYLVSKFKNYEWQDYFNGDYNYILKKIKF